METIIFLLLGLIFVLILGIVFLFFRASQTEKIRRESSEVLEKHITDLRDRFADREMETQKSLTEQLQKINETLNKSISDINKNVGDRLHNASQAFAQVQKSVGQVQEQAKAIGELGKDIGSLQDILKSPKLRGEIGEYLLGDLLTQILPKQSFQAQYEFADGSIVDSAIFLGGKIVPIDAKFPLENFRKSFEVKELKEKKKYIMQFYRDVKKHILSISTKYIKPEENTFDFAIMYIPAENVYYETIIKSKYETQSEYLYKFAIEHKVIPVSPNSLYAYLQTIAMGLRGMQIEKNAERIMQSLISLQNDFESYRDNFAVLGKHLTNAKAKYDENSSQLDRIAGRIELISQERSTKEIE
jgi:DNA recombination protein RmuC